MPAADQIQNREGDRQSTAPEVAHRILAEQRGTTHDASRQRATNAAHSAALVHSNTLPDLQISEHVSGSITNENPLDHLVHEAQTVTADLVQGARDEWDHHPDQLVRSALTGVAIGAAAVVVGPELAGAAAIGCALWTGYQLTTNIGNWMHQADVASNTQGHTAAEVTAAHQELQRIGNRGADTIAGALGSVVGTPLGVAIRTGLAGSVRSVDATVVTVTPRFPMRATLRVGSVLRGSSPAS